MCNNRTKKKSVKKAELQDCQRIPAPHFAPRISPLLLLLSADSISFLRRATPRQPARSSGLPSVVFAALAVAAPGEAEIPWVVLEGEVIQDEAGVLLYEESELVCKGGD